MLTETAGSAGTRSPRDYPASRLRVAGEQVDVDTWRAMYDLLQAPHQHSIAALLWGINVHEPEQELRRLMAAPTTA